MPVFPATSSDGRPAASDSRLPSPADGGFCSVGFAPVLDILVHANANHGSADCVLERLLTGDYRREA